MRPGYGQDWGQITLPVTVVVVGSVVMRAGWRGLMGKRGIERPHVVGTRLNEREKQVLDALRGPRPVAEYLRRLIRHAQHCDKV